MSVLARVLTHTVSHNKVLLERKNRIKVDDLDEEPEINYEALGLKSSSSSSKRFAIVPSDWVTARAANESKRQSTSSRTWSAAQVEEERPTVPPGHPNYKMQLGIIQRRQRLRDQSLSTGDSHTAQRQTSSSAEIWDTDEDDDPKNKKKKRKSESNSGAVILTSESIVEEDAATLKYKKELEVARNKALAAMSKSGKKKKKHKDAEKKPKKKEKGSKKKRRRSRSNSSSSSSSSD